jgi:ferrous iron transport protein A
MAEGTGTAEKPFPLAIAQEGERVRVAALRGGRQVQTRLTELGLNVGAQVTVSQRQAGRMVIVRDGMRLALGVGMTRSILVTPA